jgi:transcriptional regulator with XRE-family HTH domain
MNAHDHFAGRLKELRIAAGLTQKQLADKAAMSQAGIADLEQGRNKPSWASVLALAAALGVDCRAFQQEPASDVQQGRGRPAKATADESPAEPEPAPETKPKRPKRKKK